MPNKFENFWISQAAIIIKNGKLLILELASKPGYWDIPGGRIDVNEGDDSIKSFRREIKEELDVSNFDIIDIIDYDIWYVNKSGNKQGVCALFFLIDNLNTYNIKLSFEHKNFKWISMNELGDDKFFWPGAVKILRKGFHRFNELNNKK